MHKIFVRKSSCMIQKYYNFGCRRLIIFRDIVSIILYIIFCEFICKILLLIAGMMDCSFKASEVSLNLATNKN